MKHKAILLMLAWLGLAILGTGVIRLPAAPKPSKVIDPPNELEVELTVVEKGNTYKLFHAGLWRVDRRSGKWEFMEQIYDPEFYAQNYVERDGAIYRKGPNGQLIAVRRRFSEDFESAKTIHDLISVERGWTAFTLQSPRTPTVKDYVALRKRLLNGQADFLDNRIEPTAERVHAGKGALKTVSVVPVRGMVCAKASLDTELLHFVKGDDVWFSGWYYVPQGSAMPFTVMDLETTWIKEYPGIRIALSGGKFAMFELKWGSKPVYRQARGKEVPFPRGRWVSLKAHLVLSEKPDGIIELWQDGVKIVDARGQTLPLAHTIYNNLEVGISAYSEHTGTATLFVDDIRVSTRPIE